MFVYLIREHSQVLDDMLEEGMMDARQKNKLADQLVDAYSNFRNKHATLHGMK